MRLGDDVLARFELGRAEDRQIDVDARRVPAASRSASKRAAAPCRSSSPAPAPRSAPAHSDCRDQRRRRRSPARSTPIVSSGATPSARDSSAIAAVDAAGARDPGAIASRLRIASPITSPKVWSAAAVMAVASARPSALSGSRGGFQQHVQASACRAARRACGFVQHLEARRDIGLERKLVQQPRAEGVDGLHLQPARRLQRLGEQPARPRAPLRVRLAGLRSARSPRRARRRRASSMSASVSNTRFAMLAAAALV